MSSGFQLARRQAEAYESFTRRFMEGSAQLLAQMMETRMEKYAVEEAHRIPFGSYRLEAHASESSSAAEV